MQFHFHANQKHFYKNGFALRLVLKRRHKGIRKWPINQHDTSMGERKIWVPQEESNPWPPEHRARGHGIDSCRGLRYFLVRAQNSPSLLTYHYSKSVVVVVTTLFIPPRLRCSSKTCSSWIVVVCLIWQETRVRLNPRNNSSGSDYINADFVKVNVE